MSDFEDYTAVFFQECDELLDDLEERLGALTGGDRDPETVHAAFRAVHSIKGGADAFGYFELVTFAHVFESAMDAIRGGRLAPTPEVCEALIRGRDVLCDLVERAGNGDPAALPAAATMTEELVALSAGELAAEEPAAKPAEEPAEPGAASGPAGARAYRIHFAPGPEFQTSGHDPLRLIQALRGLGAVQVQVAGEIPLLADLDPGVCPLTWDIGLETEDSPDAIDSFFQIYRATAEIGITPVEAEGESPSAPPDTAATAATGAGTAPPGVAELVPIPTGEDPSRPAAAEPPASDGSGKARRNLRVDLERIDRLVNMVGEIVITQAAMAQTLADHEAANLELNHANDAMTRQIRELQDSVMAIRAQPVKGVFSRMTRLMRDLAQQLGKEVRADISGAHTEVDSTVIEELAEPLIHIIRNAMDHGIETPEEREQAGKPRQGAISISARQRGERVEISVADDGRGIDRDRVLAKAVARGVVEPGAALAPEEVDQLVFHPGLSTTETVSNVSGRGVGLDVVRRNIGALGGRVALENRPGAGTSITITLPLSLAVLDGMTIAVGGQRFVIPLGAVVEALTLSDAAPHRLPSGARVMVRRDQYLPLLSVRDALGVEGAPGGERMVVIVDTDADARIGLLVDELIGQRQVVLKSLEANYRGVPGVSGATILSDGRAALILDVPALRLLAVPGAPFTKLEYVQ
jgi:two-component system chemotaxis sensor kinase CheA